MLVIMAGNNAGMGDNNSSNSQNTYSGMGAVNSSLLSIERNILTTNPLNNVLVYFEKESRTVHFCTEQELTPVPKYSSGFGLGSISGTGVASKLFSSGKFGLSTFNAVDLNKKHQRDRGFHVKRHMNFPDEKMSSNATVLKNAAETLETPMELHDGIRCPDVILAIELITAYFSSFMMGNIGSSSGNTNRTGQDADKNSMVGSASNPSGNPDKGTNNSDGNTAGLGGAASLSSGDINNSAKENINSSKNIQNSLDAAKTHRGLENMRILVAVTCADMTLSFYELKL